MTVVLPGKDSQSWEGEEAASGDAVFLDDATKQLLRQLVEGARPAAEPSTGRPVDWDAIWSLAAKGPSEELALGSVLLAAEEAAAGELAMPPSALMAAVGRDGHAHAQARGARRLPSPPLVHEARNEPKSAALVLHEAPRPPAVEFPVVREVPKAGAPGRPVVQAASPGAELPKRLRRAVVGATWVRNLGIIVVMFYVWQLWGTGIAEAHSQSQLGAQYKALVQNATPYAGVSTTLPAAPALPAGAGRQAGTVGASLQAKAFQANASLEAEAKAFSEATLPGGVLGRIRIPAIGVSDYFVAGVGEAQLQEGPGRYPGSGLPGQRGNVAIAGHRTTYGAPFFRLGEVHVGDTVIIDTPEGRATYRVSQPPFAVSPYDVDVLDDFGDARLTLTTCNPPFLATTRLIVVAKLSQWLPTGARAPVALVAAPQGGPAAVPTTSGLALHARAASPVGPKAVRLSSPSSPVNSVAVLPASRVGARMARPSPAGHLTPAAAVGPASGSTAGNEGINDAATVGQAATAEGNGWHMARLPLVLAVVIALCALGALYERAVRFFTGISHWFVMVPLWAAGLLVLFRVLGLLLPADL